MNKKILRTVQTAMLTAISIVLLYLVRIPLIPSAPFLEYDMADVPVLIGSMLFGTVNGMAILFAVCLIQAFTVSASSGIIGFFMHFISSGVLVTVSSLIYKRVGKAKGLIIGLVCGSLAMTAVMVPLNLIFTGIFLGAGTRVVAQMLIPAIIPFNLLKAGLNSALTLAVFPALKKILAKFL